MAAAHLSIEPVDPSRESVLASAACALHRARREASTDRFSHADRPDSAVATLRLAWRAGCGASGDADSLVRASGRGGPLHALHYGDSVSTAQCHPPVRCLTSVCHKHVAASGEDIWRRADVLPAYTAAISSARHAVSIAGGTEASAQCFDEPNGNVCLLAFQHRRALISKQQLLTGDQRSQWPAHTGFVFSHRIFPALECILLSTFLERGLLSHRRQRGQGVRHVIQSCDEQTIVACDHL